MTDQSGAAAKPAPVAPKPTAPPNKGKGRLLKWRPSWKWVPGAFVLAGAILALGLAWRFLDRASHESTPLTNLEQTFFGAYTLVVGGAISWVVTHYYAQRETREQFQQLARPALRRVIAARESADLVLAAIDRRRRASEGDNEPFKSLRELVEQHARVLDDAIADWQEVLPVEAELAQQMVTSSATYESAFARIEDRFEELEAHAQTATQASDPQIEELRKEIDHLRSELRDRPRTISAFTDYPRITAGGAISQGTISMDNAAQIRITPTDG